MICRQKGLYIHMKVNITKKNIIHYQIYCEQENILSMRCHPEFVYPFSIKKYSLVYWPLCVHYSGSF